MANECVDGETKFWYTRMLFINKQFNEIDTIIKSLNSHKMDAVEFNQGPTKVECHYIKYMIDKYNCKYGFIGYCSYLVFVPNGYIEQYKKTFDDYTQQFLDTHFPNVEHIYYK